jgi:hypothetical protein
MQLLQALKDTVSQNEAASIDSAYAYDMLSNERRRRVIAFLSDFDPGHEVPVGDIADHLAAAGDDRTAAYVALLQSHLQQLDTGLIDYDERAKTVTVRPALHTIYRASTLFENEL